MARIAPPRRPISHPDRAIECRTALEPAFAAWADRMEAAGTANYQLVDMTVEFEEGRRAALPGDKLASLDELASRARAVGWEDAEIAAALVALAVARCQTALAGETEVAVERDGTTLH